MPTRWPDEPGTPDIRAELRARATVYLIQDLNAMKGWPMDDSDLARQVVRRRALIREELERREPSR